MFFRLLLLTRFKGIETRKCKFWSDWHRGYWPDLRGLKLGLYAAGFSWPIGYWPDLRGLKHHTHSISIPNHTRYWPDLRGLKHWLFSAFFSHLLSLLTRFKGIDNSHMLLLLLSSNVWSPIIKKNRANHIRVWIIELIWAGTMRIGNFNYFGIIIH